jgi:hypothetical protein
MSEDITTTPTTWNWRGTDREAAARRFRERFGQEPPVPPEERRDNTGVTLAYPLEVNDGRFSSLVA